MSDLLRLRIIFFFFLMPFLNTAQTSTPEAAVKDEDGVQYPQYKFKGLLQVRHLESFGDNVDAMGTHHTGTDFTQSTFDIKRMRVGLNTKLSEATEVVVLVNLADFKSDTKGKVLENAYGKYTFNKHLALTGGQFRPAFGLEELVPVDIIKSFDFSNQYYEFGKNGWTSFQIGAAASGAVDIGKLPISYFFSAVNGNGKNQAMDKDNGRQYSGRLVFGLSKKHKINLGLNGGMGKVFDEKVFAIGADVTSDFRITDQLAFDLQIEYKLGTNHNLYFSLPADTRVRGLDDYQMRGIYFLPNFRYVVNYKKLTALEISCRYETFDANYKVDPNVKQTYTPMVSLEFGHAYTGRIEAGFQIDRFDKNIPNTAFYNNEVFLIQLQLRL